jgi:hypothetical protein
MNKLGGKFYCKFEKKHLTKDWIFFAKLLKHTFFFPLLAWLNSISFRKGLPSFLYHKIKGKNNGP